MLWNGCGSIKFVRESGHTGTDAQYTFKWFNDFKKTLNKKVFNFYESKTNILETNKVFHVKKKSIPIVIYTAINPFCWNVRDEINVLFGKDLTEKQNLSNTEKKALKALIKNRNEVICVNDTDNNLGAISADKEDVSLECRRQLYDIITYNKCHGKKQKNFLIK